MTLLSLKLVTAALLALGLSGCVFFSARNPNSWVRRMWLDYLKRLESSARATFTVMDVGKVGWIQVGVTFIVLAFAAGSNEPFWLALIVPLWGFPLFALHKKHQERVQQIDGAVPVLAMALANSLRASPNIVRAFDRSREVVPAAMSDEIGVALQEVHLGRSINEALVNMSDRVKVIPLDLMITGVLIGRQTGGNVSAILETNAASLREMVRIQGVIRSKTAEAKGQLWVLGLAPPFLFVALDGVSPGYFEPLTRSGIGLALIAIAVVCWFASIAIARAILAVDV